MIDIFEKFHVGHVFFRFDEQVVVFHVAFFGADNEFRWRDGHDEADGVEHVVGEVHQDIELGFTWRQAPHGGTGVVSVLCGLTAVMTSFLNGTPGNREEA